MDQAGRERASIVGAIANDGERVTHLFPNDLYFAHLSLYQFVLPMATGADVLDAGCGAGYGAAHLARNGARSVLAIDVDPQAVDFCRSHFSSPNLTFEVRDIQTVGGTSCSSYDVVFSSNTMEHVPDVRATFGGVADVLRPDGAFVLAVPPVVDEAARIHELLNPFHLHVWSPAQWRHTLAQFFEQVDMYAHYLALAGMTPDFRNTPAASSISETDFAFDRVNGGEYVTPTLTALFVARAPLPPEHRPGTRTSVHFVDGSVSRRPPGGPSVSPAVAFVEPRPIGQLPGRALRIVRDQGFVELAAEVSRYARWLRLRRQASRLLRSGSHDAGGSGSSRLDIES